MEKAYLKVFKKISLFCYFQHGEKREKMRRCVEGHESDKLIESYSLQPTIEQQFVSSSISKRFISLIKSSKFLSVLLVLSDGPHYFFYLFFL